MRKELKVFVFWPILKPMGAIADGISMLQGFSLELSILNSL